ncbi:MAG: hypothetical protein QN175_10705 [Armatimonadota bacterium]|nr:hypothetical protein [Armatimonadota bacterium]
MVRAGPVAAEMNDAAVRLEAAAAVVRRHAGGLRYHPHTGITTPPGIEMRQALAYMRESLTRLPVWVEAFAREDSAGTPSVLPAEVVEGPPRLVALADALRSALEALEGVLTQPERATLDAPYGLGAPRRPHPGALASWVAERAEALARELAMQAILRANLTLPTAEARRTSR